MVEKTILTQQTTIIAGILTIVATILGTYIYQQFRKRNIPTEWKAVGCFVAYHAENHEYRNSRHYPKMILIEVKAHTTDTVVISAPDTDPLFLTIPNKNKNEEVVIKHYRNEEIVSIDCGNEAAVWITRYALGKESGLRLAYHDGTYKRPQINKAYRDGLNSDLAAIHIINQASVFDINKRMGNSDVTAINFRPNLLVDGPNLEPYEEDNWEWVKVGDVVLKNVMEFRMSKGPEKGPVMGVLLEVFQTGIISVGDTVYVGKNS
ncbi:hypothetical protein NQ314_005175 [Rhamnusium bicolor]|uniref:MOSC domain-containing protein n=1 Tax=Rhamnusium bicolor TaxID=1586634 RepID=A0AAV8ZI48_9CUCU|nr:hypothetical protein NQ314_005175 [Rhamnusium bicolor]